ncbi:MAG: hypothetical protein CL581_16530 [Alteromonadaceae bacterium]|uniref:DUF6776 family protein n=1 Tax=unclassified Marinobacter TaxID=83889 RepID=UPI000C3F35CB|nr:DUF6776 family protein [Marinobacter sp. BGYM27]MAA66364.1 hypothetical protein [Alteromonadaceae bacterium]MBH85222.1 hypothetical protein [Alteromonadaceae bacterium]MDG5499767.1 hypothetical protein [Marinobacter sp. BGYM27]
MAEDRKNQGEFVIVRHRPGQGIRRFLILLTFSVVAAMLGYMFGMAQGGFRFSDMTKTRNLLSEELDELRTKSTTLQQERINLERGRRIDQQALKQARETIAGLETRMVSLNSDLTFYKNIMAPSQSDTGLQVQRFEIDARRKANAFAYKLVLTQVGDNKSYIEGVVAVNVIGMQDGERQVIPLRDLADEVEDLGIHFRYRYFQDIKGVLVLPEQFEPIEIQVVAKSQGRKAAKSERTFDWKTVMEK